MSMVSRGLYAISVFLIIHGALHFTFLVQYTDPSGSTTGWTGRSWLLSDPLGEAPVLFLGQVLWTIAVVGFVVAGLGLMGIPGLRHSWRPFGKGSATVSLLALFIFWGDLLPSPWPYIWGVFINLGILASLIWAWPSDEVPQPAARVPGA